MSLENAISELSREIEKQGIVPGNGLGTELFLFATSLIPIVNIDILVFNKDGRFLLAWRDDEYCGKGWHVPGGCIRLRETMLQRVHACAMDELGTDVVCVSEPVMVSEGIDDRDKMRERSHFVSILFFGRIKDESRLERLDGKELQGHLKWFDELPDDMVPVQYFYREKWTIIHEKMEEYRNGRLEQ